MIIEESWLMFHEGKEFSDVQTLIGYCYFIVTGEVSSFAYTC